MISLMKAKSKTTPGEEIKTPIRIVSLSVITGLTFISDPGAPQIKSSGGSQQHCFILQRKSSGPRIENMGSF